MQIQPVKEIRGSIEVPVSPDLFILASIMALVRRCPVSVTPIPDAPVVTTWIAMLQRFAQITVENGALTLSPMDQPSDSTPVVDATIIPVFNFSVSALLCFCTRVQIVNASEAQITTLLGLYKRLGMSIACSRSETALFLALQGDQPVAAPQSILDHNEMHLLLGCGAGLGRRVECIVAGPVSSPVRALCDAVFCPFGVKSTQGEREKDPVARRMRFMAKSKKKEPTQQQEFAVSVDFSIPASQPVALTIPGDPTLAALIIAAKALVQKGTLTIGNVPLESWAVATIAMLRKMSCPVGLQESGATSFGSVGLVTLQKFKLIGRKLDCSPLFACRNQLPIMVMLAAYSEGQSVFRELAPLRDELPDGIEEILQCIRTLGCKHGSMPDGIVLEGNQQYDGFDLAQARSAALAGACAVAAIKCTGNSTIVDDQLLAHWPHFTQILSEISLTRE